MSRHPLLLSTLLLAGPIFADESPAPAPFPVARYAAMGGHSPFALATAAAPAAAPQASFAANWYVSGIARLGDTDFVTIKSRDASQQFSLFGREPQNGVAVASVQWSETVGKSTVILQKGTETAKLEFNEADLRGPAPVTPDPKATSPKPGGPPHFGPGGTRPPIVVPGQANRQYPGGSPPSGEIRRRVRVIGAPTSR